MTRCKYYKQSIIKNYNTSDERISNLVNLQGCYNKEKRFCELYQKECICKGKAFSCDFDKSRRNSFNAVRRKK